MKTRLPLILVLLIMTFGYTQNIPTVKVKDKPLGLTSLDIKVDVVGNIATTTYDMLFYNPTKNVLEGELSFPLGEGHDVSRFALDVNGKLREAVVVDKELGRIAFEQVVRRRVDPALLEKGTGNNYKARIYPIPATGHKRVVLAYEQELVYRKGDHFYNLPLGFKNVLEHFSLEITVFDQKSKPIIAEGQISGLEFSTWNKNYSTKVIKKNFKANKNILIKIPVPINSEKTLTYDNYFYIYKTLNPKKRLRAKPKDIALFWDASLSMKDRDIKKETEVLDNYFKHLNNVTVHYVSFSNVVIHDEQFEIVNGAWDDLRKVIIETIYDGGTNYDIIYNRKNNVDSKLLFSEGITSLSTTSLDLSKPLFIVNSLTKSNHSALNHLAESSNGAYLNLNTKSNEDVMASLKYENYKFLGYESQSKNLEVYPKAPVSVTNDFSISGKYLKNNETIRLNFGYGNQVQESIAISIDKSNNQSDQVRRIWAQKKLDHLEIDSKANKNQIKKHGVLYDLVSDYTSLIVLENVMDYITYRITPPDELKDEYNALLARIESEKSKRYESAHQGFLESPLMLNAGDETQFEMDSEIVEVEEMEVVGNVHQFGILASEVSDEVVETEDRAYIPSNNITRYEEQIPFVTIEKSPVFPGCQGNNEALKKCLSENVSNHVRDKFNLELANDLGLSGRQRVSVLFDITAEGEIGDIRVRSPHPDITDEIMRVIRLLPKMKPGEQRGKPVDVRYSLPIMFELKGERGSIAIDTSIVVSVIDYKKYSGKLEVRDRKVKAEYISQLKHANNKDEAYLLYLKQRNNYLDVPAYYIDVSNYFQNRFKDHKYSSIIASNIAETDFDNYELLKVYGYHLQENKYDGLALFIFKRILDLRPEDSQSYRDLALAYEAVGKCQRALDLYNDIITGKIYENAYRRIFKGVALIAENEIKHLIKKYRNDLDLSRVDKRLLDEVVYDVRVVVDWNHNDTDIDLHVIDPNLEECFYKHTSTNIGGHISPDMTQGFGPEEFTLINAIKGDYYIKIKYYGDRYQKEENPTFMKVTMYKNYGTKNEEKKITIIRLTKKDNEEMIAKLSI
ncbi:VIT domain-containing protein [Seonamhaeicola aphaedonensis]|uniref:TonB-like protein n=1 Tax=Seonamhaeicola aphaedonensis TaxID=1461338 RepID=A0A3D9HH29_9FLAO|nr:VIT domain-containing protein [Seonamhaeicola aphaedonensis]RED48819.1 TonB-like protein [Seonamhaeicola aphaedonensis]